MPRLANADRILSEARDRVRDAALIFDEKREAYDRAGVEATIANRTLAAHQEAYDALEKALAPKPRKKAELKLERAQRAASQGESDGKPEDKRDLLCGACGNIKGHPDHDIEHYLGAHEFDPGKSGKKSKQKSVAAGAEKETAIAVGVGELKT